MITDELTLRVLRRFEVELHDAGPDQFEHLARRAEANYASDELCDAMHELVDHERAGRAGSDV